MIYLKSEEANNLCGDMSDAVAMKADENRRCYFVMSDSAAMTMHEAAQRCQAYAHSSTRYQTRLAAFRTTSDLVKLVNHGIDIQVSA